MGSHAPGHLRFFTFPQIVLSCILRILDSLFHYHLSGFKTHLFLRMMGHCMMSCMIFIYGSDYSIQDCWKRKWSTFLSLPPLPVPLPSAFYGANTESYLRDHV